MEPRVHGKIIAAEPEAGSAAIATAVFDSYQINSRDVHTLPRQVTLTFFCPNCEPSILEDEAKVWVEFECFADWESLSESRVKDASIQPAKDRRNEYEYSLIGEIFSVKQSSGSKDLYINAVVPILLTLGSRTPTAQTAQAKEGITVRLSKGRLYGHIEPG